MSFAFAFKVGKDFILSEEESAATAASFAFGVLVTLEEAAELTHRLAGEPSPSAFGSPVCHVDGLGGLCFSHLGSVDGVYLTLAIVR